MKNGFFNSTLSCILKCISFKVSMINKKIIFGLFIISFLGACTSPTAMLGPIYTFTSTGNVYQTALSYGSNKEIKEKTGKTPIENLKEINLAEKKEKKNIKKNTLESEEFHILVKKKVEKSFVKFKSISQ